MTDPRAWDPALIERAKLLWNDGMKPADIGDLIGKTRNSIIGMSHRQMWAARRTEPRKPRAQVKRQKPKTVRISTQAESIVPPTVFKSKAGPVTLMERQDRQCCWPLDGPHGAAQLFCGEFTYTTYCEYHYNKYIDGRRK